MERRAPPSGIPVFSARAMLDDPRVGADTIFAGIRPFVGLLGAASPSERGGFPGEVARV
jgi:hypothetical protein